MNEEITPNLSHNDLRDYFLNKRPKELDIYTFENLSCMGMARLLIEHFGGASKARAYWLEEWEEEKGTDVGHAWVVKNGQAPESIPFNNWLGLLKLLPKDATVEKVIQEGEDITQLLTTSSWRSL